MGFETMAVVGLSVEDGQMRKEHRPGDFECPVGATVAVIGGKWKPTLVHYLLRSTGPCRFGELRRRLPTATQQMLTNQLRELEADGIVHRQVYAQVPPKVEYSLTELGRSLAPVIRAMCEWGERYENEVLAAVSGGAGGARP